MIIEQKMDGSDWQAYVEQVSMAQGYTLEAAQAERVAAQMALVAQVAQPLLGLQLVAGVEPAAVFNPVRSR